MSYELTYTNICRGHFPDLAAIRKALQWGGTWATVEDAKGHIYSLGAEPNGNFNNYQRSTENPVTLLCLARSDSIEKLEIYWPLEAKHLQH